MQSDNDVLKLGPLTWAYGNLRSGHPGKEGKREMGKEEDKEGKEEEEREKEGKKKAG